MIRRILIAAALAFAACASWAQALPTAQLQTLKTAIAAQTDPEFVGYRNNGQTPLMAAWFNAPSTFIVYRKSVQTMEVGKVINYDAVGALTTANTARLDLFVALNADSFSPTADVRTFFDATFSGALAGAGQATRDALQALWRRQATRAEQLFATGTGTTLAPGALVFEGSISDTDISAALAL